MDWIATDGTRPAGVDAHGFLRVETKTIDGVERPITYARHIDWLTTGWWRPAAD